MLEDLKNNYSNHKNAKIVNCAVGNSGSIKLYSVKEELINSIKRTYMKNIQKKRIVAGFVSSDINHVIKHAKKLFHENIDIRECIEEITVQSDNLLKLMEQINENKLDILQIDIKNFNNKIIYNSNIDILKPKIINFKYIHLPSKKFENLINYLNSLNYSIYQYNSQNTLTIKQNLNKC
jgi:hypothetical protein